MRESFYLAVLCAVLASCGVRSMGTTCSSSEQCAGEGLCLKGVCSGYACLGDEDCTGDMACGSVAGVPVCVLACDGDTDCSGEQECTSVQVESGDTGEERRYCL